MNTEFYVTVGEEAFTYGKEREDSFDVSVIRIAEQIQVHFFFKGSRHHVGSLKTESSVARWLAHALLAATDGAPDATINRLRVEKDQIVQRFTQAEIAQRTAKA